MSIEELKRKYNNLLAREVKAEEVLNRDYWINKNDLASPYRSLEEEEKHKKRYYEEFFKIIRELSALIKEYEEIVGKEMTESEKINGFIID